MVSSSKEIKDELFSRKLRKYGNERGAVIPLLQAAQEIYSYVPKEVISMISEATKIPQSSIYGVVTFYKQFRLKPVGKHIIKVCQGTACHVNGANEIMKAVEEHLNVKEDENTDDGLFTLQSVACLGCCSLSPAVMIDDETYGKLTPDSIRGILDSYRKNEGEKK
ncbi:NADH-quinone oxidoreductase subunit NuoE [candidate division WOR-3 bacterium]|nr:NADH-quinone oxidoreductase subunit NuoE [candidate division WOR-3 bacterium]